MAVIKTTEARGINRGPEYLGTVVGRAPFLAQFKKRSNRTNPPVGRSPNLRQLTMGLWSNGLQTKLSYDHRSRVCGAWGQFQRTERF